jgi:aspartyl-tRNA(Asn)/glutamyl-tRNA(Gln) amidotransferase subunit A
MLDNFKAPYDATVVAKLAAAGAVTLGKTNMDEFAMGSANESSYYGAVKNPWNLEHVPGGSSGGSAAAVAARLLPAATDTGGSIRQPAAFTNLTGLKPTYGRVSRWGMIAYASSLDQGGPLARTAEDCAILLQGMAGFDPRTPPASTSRCRTTAPASTLAARPAHRRAEGILQRRSRPAHRRTGPQQRQRAGKARRRDQGNQPAEHAARDSGVLRDRPGEASSNLSRFDGVRFGYRCEPGPDRPVQALPWRRLRPKCSAGSWSAPTPCRPATTTPTT